jgi:hypothetical protein
VRIKILIYGDAACVILVVTLGTPNITLNGSMVSEH